MDGTQQACNEARMEDEKAGIVSHETLSHEVQKKQPCTAPQAISKPHNQLKRPPYFVFLSKNTIFATGIYLNSIKRTTYG